VVLSADIASTTETPSDDEELVVVQPTPATTPAKPLIDKPRTPSLRLLTDKEFTVLENKINSQFRVMRSRTDGRPGTIEWHEHARCAINIRKKDIFDLARGVLVTDADVKVIMNPKRISAANASDGGFIPDNWQALWSKGDIRRRAIIFRTCGPEPDQHRPMRLRGSETTPAKPLIDKPRTPSFRLLTDKEHAVLKQKVINSFPRPRVPENKKTRWDRKMEVYERCVLPIFINEFLDFARVESVNDADVKVIMDPAKIQAKNASKGGFIPDKWEAVWMKDHTRTGRLAKFCGPQPTRTPENTALPSVDSGATAAAPPSPGETVIGVPGKFGNEGGTDVNNGVAQLYFKPAKTALVHIEHVDVHRGDPVNKNGSITFIYQGGIKHKFVFVGNGGLRFRKQDGSFGPNLGVGDVSKTVLTGMGLNYLTYKIECLRTAGRNTWRFKPLRLDRGLISIELSDNADWGGLRGVFAKVTS
jgi:hypothetical protein